MNRSALVLLPNQSFKLLVFISSWFWSYKKCRRFKIYEKATTDQIWMFLNCWNTNAVELTIENVNIFSLISCLLKTICFFNWQLMKFVNVGFEGTTPEKSNTNTDKIKKESYTLVRKRYIVWEQFLEKIQRFALIASRKSFNCVAIKYWFPKQLKYPFAPQIQCQAGVQHLFFTSVLIITVFSREQILRVTLFDAVLLIELFHSLKNEVELGGISSSSPY